jgi:hypothetical protein
MSTKIRQPRQDRKEEQPERRIKNRPDKTGQAELDRQSTLIENYTEISMIYY